MSSISTQDARGIFTKTLIDVYKERISPLSFLRSFFPSKESMTKEISIEVQRGTEKVAVDVERGTEGNRNSFSRSSEKIFVPPYYREWFDATELDLYDRLFGAGEIDSQVFSAFVDSVAEKLGILRDKIERAYELQCAQVLETGIVTLNSGINIDFKRKAGSLVSLGAGNWWDAANVNPVDSIAAACKWIRQNGKAQGGTFNMILGEAAKTKLFENADILAAADLRRIDQMDIRQPQRDSVGGVSHGMISAGDYNVRIYTYPEFYDNASGTSTAYLAAKKAIIIPDNPRFNLAFAAVPQLVDMDNPVPKKGAYVFGEFKDEKNTAHVMDVKSAGVAVPVAVDQIYTMQVDE